MPDIKTHGTVVITPIGEEDLGPHSPPPGDETWQESWALAWHDPQTGAGGWHHIGLQRNRGFADVWNWIVADGEVVGRYNNLRNPLPDHDFPDFAIAGMEIKNRSLRDLRFTSTYASGARTELEYSAYTDPFTIDLRPELISMGSHHYESQGRMTGTIVLPDGTETEVNALAWADHSWGSRDWSQSLAHRWLQANFGPEAFISVWQVMTHKGRVCAGYVYADGAFHGVKSVTYDAGIHDDGYSPSRTTTSIWTDASIGFRIKGTVGTGVSVPHDAGFWMTDGLAIFEMGVRLGAGIFDVRERSLLPAEAASVPEEGAAAG